MIFPKGTFPLVKKKVITAKDKPLNKPFADVISLNYA
jgi:hypothetical protein